MTKPSPDWSQLGIHVIAKPTGPKCNIQCRYCFYLDKESLYPDESPQQKHVWQMDDRTLEAYIRQYIEAQAELGTEASPITEIDFAFQGGEPTLMGIDFFRRVVQLQKKVVETGSYARDGLTIHNSLQTNGLLLDDPWCKFLRENQFLVGISIDGPAKLHDRYRVDRDGNGTHARVVEAIKRLKRHQIDFNSLVCVNRHNANHPGPVYQFFKQQGVKHLQFIPIVVPLRDQVANAGQGTAPKRSQSPKSLVSPDSVLPDQFGRFLIHVFDQWVRDDVGRIFVRDFDQALSVQTGAGATLCVYSPECGRATAIEHNGDLYACDHFVDPEHLLGNIHDRPIRELVNSPVQRKFGTEKRSRLPQQCLECEFLAFCNGACPKDRIIATGPASATDESDRPLNYLCAGFRQFFEHIGPYIDFMADELRAGRSPANIMQRLRAIQQNTLETVAEAGSVAEAETVAEAGPVATVENTGTAVRRNDPCPCQSGRKFKQCCGRRRS